MLKWCRSLLSVEATLPYSVCNFYADLPIIGLRDSVLMHTRIIEMDAGAHLMHWEFPRLRWSDASDAAGSAWATSAMGSRRAGQKMALIISRIG
jgi:hypothetical protein